MSHSIKPVFFQVMLSIAIAPCLSLFAEKITIKSCNVLYESLYQKWAKGVQKMPTNDRKNLLIKAFDDPDQFAQADILCFQEWDILDSDNALKNTLDNHNYVYAYIQCNFTNRPDGLLIAWKKDKFILLAKPVTYIFENTNRALGVKLKLGNGKTIYVVSLHASFILGYARRYESILNQVENIKNHVKQVPTNASFICGDFNYNTHSKSVSQYPNRELFLVEAAILYPKLMLHGWNDSRRSVKESPSFPTLFGITGFERVDYLLFRGEANPLAYWQYPKNPQSLIKHNPPLPGEGPDYANYFSDHAIICATFDVR